MAPSCATAAGSSRGVTKVMGLVIARTARTSLLTLVNPVELAR